MLLHCDKLINVGTLSELNITFFSLYKDWFTWVDLSFATKYIILLMGSLEFQVFSYYYLINDSDLLLCSK